MEKKISAPHRKTTNTIPRGTSVQTASRVRLPWMGVPISSGDRRRKRIAKPTTRQAMRTEKNAATARSAT